MKRIVTSLAMALAVLAAPSAFADITTYRATLSGPAEAIPVASPGAGIATIVIDDTALTMQVSIPFFDLLGTTVAAHLHCCTMTPLLGTSGVATPFNDFPTSVRAGLYEQTFDLNAASSFSPAFINSNGGDVTAAREILLKGIGLNQSYLNIHTNLFPGGEIRGFLVALPAAPVPEPSTYAMLAIGLAGVGFMARRKQRAGQAQP